MGNYSYRRDLSETERVDLLFEMAEDMNEAIKSLAEGIEGLQEEINTICEHIDNM